MWGLIEMRRDEYRYKELGIRDYIITFLKIPIFCARFTTTNNNAVNILTPIREENRKKIVGFTIEENETKNKRKKNKQKA